LARLLARYADCIFWMARYMERAENLARILDVNQSSASDAAQNQNWRAVVEINSDQARFFAAHSTADARSVIQFYMLDAANPTSILHAVSAARENARTLRSLISTEMWTQINVFYNWLRALDPADLTAPDLPRLFTAVKEACQTHTGITEGTFFRDQGWYFYQLGNYIERADQTTRLLDVKFHQLATGNSAVSPLEAGLPAALLRSAAGYHAFRRVHPHGMVPADVVGFLLLNDAFPRSVRLCVNEIDSLLHDLRQRHRVRGGAAALETADEIRVALLELSPEDLMRAGLHQFLDWIQRQLNDMTDTLTQDFFGH
jgi:uncharacterized alpha-E superfamily protein